jgi:hypothetical protein
MSLFADLELAIFVKLSTKKRVPLGLRFIFSNTCISMLLTFLRFNLVANLVNICDKIMSSAAFLVETKVHN